jgi:hypothetical protein
MTITITPDELSNWEASLNKWFWDRFSYATELYKQLMITGTYSPNFEYSVPDPKGFSEKIKQWDALHPMPTAMQYFFPHK